LQSSLYAKTSQFDRPLSRSHFKERSGRLHSSFHTVCYHPACRIYLPGRNGQIARMGLSPTGTSILLAAPIGNSDSLTNLMKLRFLISTSCPITAGTSVRVSRAAPSGFPCVSPLLPRKPTCRFRQFSLRQVLQPSPFDPRVGNSVSSYEATYRFAFAATRRFARLTS